MSESLTALQELFAAHEKVYKTVKDESTKNISVFADVSEAMDKAVNEKDFEKHKKGVVAALDQLEKIGGALEINLVQWGKTGKELQKTLEAEKKTREEEYKKIRQDAEDIERLNKNITEFNKGKDPKSQLPLEKTITISIDGVATVAVVASTLIAELLNIELKQASLKAWMKEVANHKKLVAKQKFQPPKGRK